MPAKTANLKLTKPLLTENYDVGVWNTNSDIVDEAIGNCVIKNDDITPNTAIKVTYDAKGLITDSAELLPDDIPELDITKITGLGQKISESTWNEADLVKYKGVIELDKDAHTAAKLEAKNEEVFDALDSPPNGVYWYYVKAMTMEGYVTGSDGKMKESNCYIPWGILLDMSIPFSGEDIETAEYKEGYPGVIPPPIIPKSDTYSRLQRLELMTSPTAEKRRVFVRIQTDGTWGEWQKAEAELASKKYVDAKAAANKVGVVDNLSDTSKDKALSANQGKALDGKISALQANTTQIGNGKFSAGGAQSNTSGVAIGKDSGTEIGIGIGTEAFTESGTALGKKATTRSGVAIGDDAYTYAGVAVGNGAKTEDSELGGTAIGKGAMSAGGGFAGGENARATYLTEGAPESQRQYVDAVQLGKGDNGAAKTFQVYDYRMMDAEGNIPYERMKLLKLKSIPHTTAEGESVSITDQLADEEVISCRIYGASGGTGDLDGTSGKYKIPVICRGKNMLKIIDGYMTFGGDIPNTIIRATKDAAIAIGRVVPNSSYVFTSSNSNESGRYFFYTNYPVGTSEKAIGGCYYGKQAKQTINVPENANYIVFRVSAGAGTAVLENLQLESGTASTEYEPYTETTATAVLDTALGENDYIDIIEKKRYTNGAEVSDITVEGELKTADSSKCEIECQTNVQPSKVSMGYYQDINKVITEMKNAVLSQGGNV